MIQTAAQVLILLHQNMIKRHLPALLRGFQNFLATSKAKMGSFMMTQTSKESRSL